jgi:hypothetical protein
MASLYQKRQPDGIAASAYTVSGEPAGVLKVIDEPKRSNKTFSLTVDLNKGEQMGSTRN